MENTDLNRTDNAGQGQKAQLQQNKQRSEKSKTIILTLVLSFFIIGGLGTWGYYSVFNSAASVDAPSDEELTEAEKSSGTALFKPTIEVPKTEIQRRINVIHEFWNNELGYDKWSKYNIDTHTPVLNEIEIDIRNKILPYVAGPLKTDIENALKKIEKSKSSESVEPLKGVHRIFHDLDMSLNDYKASDYWDVTETGKWIEKEIEE
ncbi:hypothetical protein [Fictibacillus sp. 18YEL24]|uniref:hypothetical protein n=1 Tax=Fictibacillus sp. 18YEL24 TaxID=2745875 RepID=UPI0018CF8200|nr:hypothetical protein [Fictibacillus sp. 18YEL24]MBH0169396.1 hypothetical protein [Fictibacillus sp. 18YEL24]